MRGNQLIGIFFKGVNLFQIDTSLCNSFIEGCLVDTVTETVIKANTSKSNNFLFARSLISNSTQSKIRFSSHECEKLLTIDDSFYCLESKNKIFFFEIVKFVEQPSFQSAEKMRIAWAFLIPVGPDGSVSTNVELKLQLYKVRRDCKISHQDCSVLHLYSDHKWKKFLGFLRISIKGIIPRTLEVCAENKQNTVITKATKDKLLSETILSLKSTSQSLTMSRFPGQYCKVPNRIYKVLFIGKTGVSCLRFSHSGIYIASSSMFNLTIHEVRSGKEVVNFSSHFGFVYDLDWSLDDRLLLSVSNDYRGAVWSLVQKTLIYILPHPCYVYCGKWFHSNKEIVTGGKDRLIRYWRKGRNGFDLIEEIPGHSGFVSSLTFHHESFLFSGDSQGCVIIHKFSESRWTCLKKLHFSEFSLNVVDAIHVHSNRRVLISVRCRGSYLVDISSETVLLTFKSTLNVYARSVACLTPCNSFLYSFCQSGVVGVWEVNTGKLLAVYENLFSLSRFSDLSGFIDYHPQEHLVGIAALGQNFPLLLLRYDSANEDPKESPKLTFFT